MDWTEILNETVEFFREHGVKFFLTILLGLVSSTCTFFFARKKWRARQDMDIIHYSQNTFVTRNTGTEGENEHWLILDVHGENTLEEDFPHPMARRLLRKAAKKTTEKQPFLDFDPDDRWYILNLVRLAIAEPFKYGTVAKLSQTAKFEAIDCIFAITYERYPGMRQGKMRVMIVRQSDLREKRAYVEGLRVESPAHKDRIKTLQLMTEDFLRGEGHWDYCMSVRLNVQL